MGVHYITVAEQVKLIGEGEYNLNALTSIEVTDSYLGLDEKVKKCQKEEPLQNCTTRRCRDTLLGQCGCLPFHMNLEVMDNEFKYKVIVREAF